MATTKIWDGITWRDLQGPQGPEGPTVVSADTVNFARLGTDGKLLVAKADLDPVYVNAVGDTMTGALAIHHTGNVALDIAATTPSQAISRFAHYADTVVGPRFDFLKRRGTMSAPLPIQSGDAMGALHWRVNTTSGADRVQARLNAAAYSAAGTAGVDCTSEWVVASMDGVKPSATVGLENKDATGRRFYVVTETAYIASNLGVGWSTPTFSLEVGGSTMMRGTLDVVGNITSSGTAHSFAANSIPSSAVVGDFAFTPATSAAAGAVGSMKWDENYLYIKTATAWKRIALTAF